MGPSPSEIDQLLDSIPSLASLPRLKVTRENPNKVQDLRDDHVAYGVKSLSDVASAFTRLEETSKA